jgi:hypothetical protein
MFALTLLSITFALLFEIHISNPVALSFAWIAESIVFSLLGYVSEKKLFTYFARVAAVLAWIIFFKVHEIMFVHLLMACLMIAFTLSQCVKKRGMVERVWLYASLAFSSIRGVPHNLFG